MILYTNGCSHTAGGCFKYPHNLSHSWPNFLMKSIMGDAAYSLNPLNANFNKNSNVLYNQALHGAGNDYIYHISLETISSLLLNENKPDYVIIQWSGPNRRMHILPDKYVFVNLWDSTEFGVKYEPYGSLHTIHYMFSLQEFLKNNNINYLFFNYMALDESIKESFVFTKLDMNRFLNFGLGDSILFNGLIDFLKSKNMCCDDAGHPNDDGNYLISKEISNKLNINPIDIKTFNKLILI